MYSGSLGNTVVGIILLATVVVGLLTGANL
jgi:hypothetical protein